jgi:uncharacterized protein (DUF433 family)
LTKPEAQPLIVNVDVLDNYPVLTKEDLNSVFIFAAQILEFEMRMSGINLT